MMKKILLPLAIIPAVAFGFADDDFDGVENKFDKCPNTSMDELVDFDGCPKTKLSSRPKLDVEIGFHYYKNDVESSTSNSFSANAYFDRLNVEVVFSPSTSQNDDEASSDSLDVSMFYKFDPAFDVATWLGAGVSIPTSKSSQNNEKMNYSMYANISKQFENSDLFGGISYTFINSQNTIDTTYQNTFGYYFGGKFYVDDFKSYDIQYSKTSSEIVDEEAIENIYFGANYNLTSNWFARIEIATGLSQSADDFGLSTKIGYSF